jgi:anti-sigma regulatory factor (Ser/Thr protein kinase)
LQRGSRTQQPADLGDRAANAKSRSSEADSARFAPQIGSLMPLMVFAAEVFARRGLPPEWLAPVQLAMEELFTNMVKYGGERREPVLVQIAVSPGGVEVTLTDHDVAHFDVTQAPAVDTSRPLQEREPGGLGLHLTRRLVDRLQYSYDPQRREARIAFSKWQAGGGRQ